MVQIIRMLAVAFSGKVGSGKTALSKAIATTLGWFRVGFGDYVRNVVRERGLAESRENLQKVGTELLEADPNAFCSAVLSSCGWTAPAHLIIDGLRHTKTVGIIQELILPARLRIVSILVSDQTRLRRLEQRSQPDAASIAMIEAHSSEKQVDFIRLNLADLVLDGEKPLETLVEQVITWIKAQS